MVERRQLPIAPKPDNLCESCNGACCQAGAILELSDAERDFLTTGGTKLVATGARTRAEREAQLRAKLEKAGLGDVWVVVEGPEDPTYITKTDCGYLRRTLGQMAICTAYLNPRRPRICGAFEAGSDYCRDFRKERGVELA